MELRQFFYKTLIVVGTLVGVYLLFEIRSIIVLFFGALLFASTVRPVVVFLSERKVPEVLSILVIYLGFLALVLGTIVVLFPSLLSNAQSMLGSQTSLVLALDLALVRIKDLTQTVTGLTLPVPSVLVLQQQITDLQKTVQEHFQASLLDGFRMFSEALILFVLSFYWLTERDRFEDLGLRMIPMRHREKFRKIFSDVESTLGAFVRGQFILCVAIGIMAFIALSLLGVQLALVLAVFAAVTEAIPMIGPVLGAIPAIIIALLDSPEKAILVTIAYIVIQQLESQLLVPKVMEHQVGLSPLFVLLALTAGNLLGGIGGAIIAIPIAATLKIIVRELVVVPTVQANSYHVEGGAVILSESPAEQQHQTSENQLKPAPEAPPAKS